MKTKPVKHKTTNTFRFKPFAERINSIDIRHAALYQIEHAYTNQPGENETHFYLALQKWHVLNLTENFKKFKKEVFGIVTIAQLIHKKDEVLEIVQKYLKLEDPLCLQPLLEILVSLAKDLRNDFYPYFPKFLDILIKLLNTKDPDRLEWTLICLAFLLKFLKPYLKRDVETVFKRIVPLLSETHPQYINNFAAESFAFVARSIKDKSKFINHMLNYLSTNDQAIVGTGHLIFEICKGVSNKFHSCAETFIPLLLEHLKENKVHQEILFKVLTQTLEDALQGIHHKEFSIFWCPVMEFIRESSKEDKIDNKSLEYILRLTGQVIERQNGKFLTNPQQFSELLVKVICGQSSEDVLEVCTQIGALLLLSSNILLSQEHAGIIIKALVPLPYPKILISFVENVIDYSQFDLHVLPPFLNFVVQSNFGDDAMCTLSKVCLAKSPLSKNGLKLFEWVKYPLNFGKGLSLIMEYIQNVLSNDIERQIENLNKLMGLLFCLPHIEKLDVELCIQKLRTLICCLLEILDSQHVVDKTEERLIKCDSSAKARYTRKVLFILANAIECAVHISSCKNIKDICDIDKLLPVILPYAADPNYLAALHLLDLYLTAYDHENGLSYAFLSLVDSFLRPNVSSPFHIVRLLITHIYKLFENITELNKPPQAVAVMEEFSIFSKCFAMESIKPSISEYRTQINIMQKLTFNTPQYVLAKGTEFHLFALKHILGVLYINFKLLWEPVTEFIAGYGNALIADEFWPTFYEALKFSFTSAKSNLGTFQFDNEINTEFEPLKDLYNSYNNIPEKPDLYNYRNLMLKTMTHCIQVCEAKNRDVVGLFLDFIENEYKRNENTNALKVDIEVYKNNEKDIDEDENEEKEDDGLELMEVEKSNDSESGKMVFKTLINVMQVLAQFKNPRALHKEPVFWELFMNFLKNKNPGLQKYALDCVLNYKNKNVMAYKSNLYNLVDDKKFKDELTLFRISEDSINIQPEDREHVIPIVLRILYGKMTSKLGADKKGGGQIKRSLVMRHLSGCKENELKMFIEMAFSYFKEYMTMKPKEIYDTVLKTLDLKSVTYPGKLHSVLNLFDGVREYFGGTMKDQLLGDLLKIFYAICSQIATVLTHVDKVHSNYIKVMKNLRIIALGILGKLFDQFDKYVWSKEELFVIFKTLIWPLTSKLHIEGVHSPTALLKLFNVWCQNPRYYILLVTCSENDSNLSALPAIFKLLLAPKTNPGVVNLILDMTEKLLTLAEDEDEENKEILPIETFKSLDIDYNLPAEVNFGSRILIPHLPSLLEIMKRRVANSAKSNTVNKRDLLILSRVTEMVTTPEMCDDLLNLLLPILVKKVCMNMAEDNMEHAVTIIINLLGHSANPQRYIKNIAVLFNKVGPVNVRKLLIMLLTSIGENVTDDKDSFSKIANIVTELNAFNKRWIDQPDFDRRLDAYKEIYKMADNDEINVDLAILIVNNCFFFIRTEKDIGLRDSAGLCLKRILPKLLLKFRSATDGQFLIRDTILSLISTGIRDSKNENLYVESISLLGVLTRECPEADVVFSDLAHFVNTDPEVDFFENICHLQLHRRVRALLKFSKIARKMIKCPTPRTLTNFILPLASIYVCDDKYADKNSLIDASIEAIATCCRLLPWYHYEVILKLYLNKMSRSSEHQKQLTRILVGIIDSFHFDFSKVQNIQLPKALLTNIPSVKPLIKKEAGENTLENGTDKVKKGDDDGISEEHEPEETSLKGQDDDIIDENDDVEENLKIADKIEETEQETVKEVVNIPAFERVTSVSPSVVNRIIKSLSSGLLPQLNRAIGKLTEHEESHKVNRRRNGIARQEEDMVRVPIALALVKLLQRLPGDILRYQLPGIIIKLCSFLKSPLKQVRILARDIVKKIMLTVGTDYLGVLLEHLTLLLTRGFQVHVLVATIHSVLDALKDNFKPGDLDKNLPYILDVCTNDLFGQLSEEKEVEKLQQKTPEARPGKKSFETLTIVSQNITEKCLINLLLPFKDCLAKHHSKKIVLKVQEALTNISRGLVTNKYVDHESVFIFLHGIASESIPEFVLGAPKREITESQREKMLRAKPDCYIIPVEPKRNKESQVALVKNSSKTNAHVLVEFSLNMLYVLLKREKVPREECRAFVDPLVPLLVDSLKSNSVKVTIVAVKCISTLWTIRLNTPTLEEMVQEIVKTIFTILHKYATAEISKQNDNFNLVKFAFKAVTALIRNVKYYTLEAEQLKTLLLYAEEDCDNDERQANSFSLLKAILEGRLVSSELHEVMQKVAKICILSDSARSRDDARALFVNYLTNYTPGKRMEKHIEFFVAQLNYEMQHGRESSLKFIEMIINKMVVTQLAKHAEFIFLALGACMVSDSAVVCRASAANSIEALLKKLPQKETGQLFDLVLAFFKDNQPEHLELGAQLATRFVNVETESFANRLPTILPIVNSKIFLLSNESGEGKFVRIKMEQDDKSDEDKQLEKDHSLIQMLNLIEKVVTHCPSTVKMEKFFVDYDDIAHQCKALLAYPHAWVRMRATKVLGHLISAITFDELDAFVAGKVKGERGFVYSDTEEYLKSLILDLCAQYTPSIGKEMADLVTDVLFSIGKLLHSMRSFRDKEDNAKLGFGYILAKLRKAVAVEVARAPKSFNIRTAIFTTWMHLINWLDREEIAKITNYLMPPIVRELSVGEGNASIGKHLASRLAKKLRRKLGDVEYARLHAEAQTALNMRRAERKKVILQEKVHNPERAAKRKLQLREKKKQAKKMKLDSLHGKKPRTKKRKAEVDIEEMILKDEDD